MSSKTFNNTKINVEFDEDYQSRTNINSGENISSLFAKIRRFMLDLKPVALSGSYNDLTDIPKTTEVMNTSETSNLITITDTAADTSLISLTAYGKSTQGYASHGGSPLGKNLLANTATPQTINGIIFTVNDDKTITVNGTATDNILLNVGTILLKANTEYVLSGCPSENESPVCYVELYDTNDILLYTETSNGININFDIDTICIYKIRISNGTILDNIVIKPMIRLASVTDDTYEPYYSNPNPDCPVPIESIGDSGSLTVTTCGKNLFYHSMRETTVMGVTYTPNPDGTITINGTATDDAWINIGENVLPYGRYIVSGCPSTDDRSVIGYIKLDNIHDNYDYGSGITLEGSKFRVSCFVPTGRTVNNLVYKPMIRLASIADDTYEPYKSTTAKITTALPLRGIPVSDGGNYTDSNGQEWICDELIVNADGTGKIIKRTLYISSSDSQPTIISRSESIYSLSFATEQALQNTKGFCSATNIYLFSTAAIVHYYFYETEALVFLPVDYDYSAEPVTMVGILKETVETDLTVTEMSALLDLQTFDGITNIYNSDGGDMFVKYWCDDTMSELITNIISTKANTSDILPISGGEMQGALIAQSNTDYTTPQVRNVSMSTEAATGGNNGQIHFQYV